MRATLLTEEQRALLASIPVQGGTLLDCVNEWNQHAARLGELTNERDTPGRSAAEARISREARNRWIRTVRTMLDVIALEAVERRRASRGQTPGEEDDPAGEPPAGEPDSEGDDTPSAP